MQLFVAQSNIERFEKLLAGEPSPASRSLYETLLRRAQGEAALIKAASAGALPIGVPAVGQVSRAAQFEAFESLETPTVLLSPDAGLHIIDVNPAYARATMIPREKAAGERLFDLFPDNPDQPDADGVAKLYASLCRASRSGRSDAMHLQRYDVRVDGVFVERYWRNVSVPLFDDQGRLAYIAHQAEDLTDEVLPYTSISRPAGRASHGRPLG